MPVAGGGRELSTDHEHVRGVAPRVVDPSNDWITSANFIPPGWHDSTNRITTFGDCATSDGGGEGGDGGDAAGPS